MRPLIFSKLARTITEHYKLIIVIWLIILLAAVPFAPMANDAVDYYDLASADGLDIDSVKADQWISDNFGSEAGADSVIIVLRSDNVLGSEMKGVVNSLTSSLIRASPAFDGGLKNNVTVTSLYSYTYTYTTSYLVQLSSVYFAAYDQLNSTGLYSEGEAADMAAAAVASDSQSDIWVVDTVAAMGRGPSIISLAAMAERIVQNSSVADFPILLPSAMVNTFVNLPSNDTMLIAVTFWGPDGEEASGYDDIAEVRELISEVLEDHPSISVYVTGTDAISLDTEISMNQDIARIDPFTIILVLVLIGLFFRSIVASAVPPAVIGLGLGISYAVVYFLGTYVMSVNYTILTLLLTSMLGAGCDYCIFILSRYKEERRNGADKRSAVETSVTWAGQAIAMSGLTVIIGFGALMLGQVDIVRTISILAVGITCALLCALTLLPSLIMLLGDRIFWPSKFEKTEKWKANGFFTKSAKFSIKHAKAIFAVAIIVSLPATYLVLTLETSYDFIATMPDKESKEGLTMISDGFGGGKITPTEIGVELSSSIFNETGGWDVHNMDVIESLCENLTLLDNVHSVTSPTRPFGETVDYSGISNSTSIESNLYDGYMRSMVGKNTSTVLITVVLKADPFASVSIDSINEIRDAAEGYVSENPDLVSIYVGGGTALLYDVSATTQNDFHMIVFVVVIGIYAMLVLIMGSVVNPLRSILTILMSISWTLAATMIFFQYLFGQSIIWTMPLILLVVCLGLGMDYDLLLSTRVREETRNGASNEDAIVHAVERTGGIITTCGIIMAGAFGTMMLSQGWLLREFGFGLMFAIILDSMIVRIFLVPAIMSLLGKWNWWAPWRPR